MAQPTYETKPALSNYGNGTNIIPNRFVVLEIQDGIASSSFTMSNHGDVLNNLLKRGVPMVEAKKLKEKMK